MATWVALLRGVNLGRNKRIGMADLRDRLESLGYDDVRTVLQSGNALFTASRGSGRDHEQKIAAKIEGDLGMQIKVLVRSAKELGAVAAGNPFAASGVDPKELHVVFLSAQPAATKLAAVDHGDFAPDEFEVGRRSIYLHLRNGVMGSRFPDWERLLGVTATTRNWNTVTRLRGLVRP